MIKKQAAVTTAFIFRNSSSRGNVMKSTLFTVIVLKGQALDTVDIRSIYPTEDARNAV
jgi:hypothetical protein